MTVILFFAGIACIIAGVIASRKNKKEGKSGAARLLLGIVAGLILLGQCRGGVIKTNYADAQEAYDLILKDEVKNIYVDGQKCNNFNIHFNPIYDYTSVEVVDRNIYFTSK